MIVVQSVHLVHNMDIMVIVFVNILIGGDCANFVGQCLIEGGHPKLKGDPCKSFHCGVQLGSKNLSNCLVQKFHWKREC